LDVSKIVSTYALMSKELLTVQQYADKHEICLAAAYKRVKNKAVEVERKFGRILIKDDK